MENTGVSERNLIDSVLLPRSYIHLMLSLLQIIYENKLKCLVVDPFMSYLSTLCSLCQFSLQEVRNNS